MAEEKLSVSVNRLRKLIAYIEQDKFIRSCQYVEVPIKKDKNGYWYVVIR